MMFTYHMEASSNTRVHPRPSIHVHGASLGTGASEFIPVPFLDEWMIKKQRRAMVGMILAESGITFEKGVPALLTGSGRTLIGRLGSMARGLILKPLKKLFRTVLFWLAARNAARTAMTTYFLARFLQHPGIVPAGAGRHLTEERARFLGQVFREISEGIDIRAAKGAFIQVVALFKRSEPASAADLAKTIERSSPGFVAEFDSMLDERLSREIKENGNSPKLSV